MEDKSGTPRGDKEIKEALQAISKELMGKNVYPTMIYYPTIIEALKELLQIRAKTKN